MRFANFHTHSRWSDGMLPASNLVREAAAVSGLEAFALTDHDTLSGLEPMFRTAQELSSLGTHPPRTVSGIEMSLYEPRLGATVHLIGLFPCLDGENYRQELKRIEQVLGEHCQEMCLKRGQRDLDQRIETAHRINLEGLAQRYASSDKVVALVRAKLAKEEQRLFFIDKKEGDLAQNPPPATYQALISVWEDLVPGSSRERISLYVLRPNSERVASLAQILAREEGLCQTEAWDTAKILQGCLCLNSAPPSYMLDPLSGLRLLHKAGGLSVLAHPAIEHFRYNYNDFDRCVTLPMIKNGLMALEVYYPYDPSYRRQAIAHYLQMAQTQNLMVSGGTDYHGDDRIGLDDLPLESRYADAILGASPTSGFSD